MAIQIHPTALVDKNAQLGEDVEIGPYASVGPDVKIGARTVVQQGAILHGHTTIGDDCQIFPYACIGMKTQDLKYVEGSVSYVEIGNRTVIREFATVHLGTKDGEKTIIGDDCLFMAYCHAAHGHWRRLSLYGLLPRGTRRNPRQPRDLLQLRTARGRRAHPGLGDCGRLRGGAPVLHYR